MGWEKNINRTGFTLSNPGLSNPFAAPKAPGLASPWANQNTFSLENVLSKTLEPKPATKEQEEKNDAGKLIEEAPAFLYQQYLAYQKQKEEEAQKAFNQKLMILVAVTVAIIIIAFFIYKKK